MHVDGIQLYTSTSLYFVELVSRKIYEDEEIIKIIAHYISSDLYRMKIEVHSKHMYHVLTYFFHNTLKQIRLT